MRALAWLVVALVLSGCMGKPGASTESRTSEPARVRASQEASPGQPTLATWHRHSGQGSLTAGVPTCDGTEKGLDWYEWRWRIDPPADAADEAFVANITLNIVHEAAGLMWMDRVWSLVSPAGQEVFAQRGVTTAAGAASIRMRYTHHVTDETAELLFGEYVLRVHMCAGAPNKVFVEAQVLVAHAQECLSRTDRCASEAASDSGRI